MPTAKKTATKKTTAKKSTALSSAKISQGTATQSSKVSRMEVLPRKTKITLIVVVIIALVGIILFLNKGLFIAGLVNGEPVSRIEVISELEKQQGGATLNRIIDKKLILQEAEEKNISVSDEEIEQKRTEIINQVTGGNEESFSQVLQSQGLTPEQFVQELRIQIMVEKMLADVTSVTDEEFNKFIQDNPDLVENAQNEEETRSQLRQQLAQQKLQTEYNTWMEELRKDADILRFVSY